MGILVLPTIAVCFDVKMYEHGFFLLLMLPYAASCVYCNGFCSIAMVIL